MQNLFSALGKGHFFFKGTIMAGQAFGVIGLEVMGRNIALNIERNGFPIAVYNRTHSKAVDFLNNEAKGKNAKASAPTGSSARRW